MMAEMAVGREMNAAVARVLGWELRHFEDGAIRYDGKLVNVSGDIWCNPDGTFARHVEGWNPWTSDADAFTALDAWLSADKTRCADISFDARWASRGWRFTLSQWKPAEVNQYDGIERYGATRAEAICRAILALGEKP